MSLLRSRDPHVSVHAGQNIAVKQGIGDATIAGELPITEMSLDKPRPAVGGTVGVDVADSSDIEAADVMASSDAKRTAAASWK